MELTYRQPAGSVHTEGSTSRDSRGRLGRTRTYSDVSHFPELPIAQGPPTEDGDVSVRRGSYLYGCIPVHQAILQEDSHSRSRRLSHDETPSTSRRFLVDVDETIRVLLEQEDTDGDSRISITDSGPKVLPLGTATSNGFNSFDVRGTYRLSSLLQELALAAKNRNQKTIVLDEAQITENPVDRISRMIKDSFWSSLTRRIDGDGLEKICADPKNYSGSNNLRIYVPHDEPEMVEYYRKVAHEKPHLNLEVEVLPPKTDDPVYMKSLNEKPGILALAMERVDDGKGGKTFKGIPFVVPGDVYNELYNWDSYFIALGLIVDGKVSLAKDIVDHFIFEIKHYNMILNGNRTYYLCRSQPPFLTNLALQIYKQLDPSKADENRAWLKRAIQAAIKEYHSVWMAEPRLDPKTGLSRYRPDGLGIPPETGAAPFLHIFEPYAEKSGLSVIEYIEKYDSGEIREPELDEYFMHDRAVRENGHDLSYRLESCCANIGTVDLQALLYKYEIDIATTILEVFGDRLEMEEDFSLSPFPITPEAFKNPRRRSSIATSQTSEEWFKRAEFRKETIDKYLWNESENLYFDYDTVKEKHGTFESVTAFWMLWAGVASEEQCQKLVTHSLKKFEVAGGLVCGTEGSRGEIGPDRPIRQWDYPYAWPPHQILAWVGLERYGYLEDAQRLAYRYLFMMTKTFVDFNGIVPEKFDAVNLTHLVNGDIGNQGTSFKMVPGEGFGWTNATYQVGLTFLTTHLRRSLAVCAQPELLFRGSEDT